MAHLNKTFVCGGTGRECNLVLDFRQTDLTPTTNIKGEINKEDIRKMTPREWARLQGYPYNFNIVVAPTLVNAANEFPLSLDKAVDTGSSRLGK